LRPEFDNTLRCQNLPKSCACGWAAKRHSVTSHAEPNQLGQKPTSQKDKIKQYLPTSKIMGYALTAQNRVTVPKAVQQALDVLPGQEIDYDVKPYGRVFMIPVKKPSVPEANLSKRAK
jgi:hypothetical protein